MATIISFPGACTTPRIQKRRPGPLPKIATDIREARFDPRKRVAAPAQTELERVRWALSIFEAECEKARRKICELSLVVQ